MLTASQPIQNQPSTNLLMATAMTAVPIFAAPKFQAQTQSTNSSPSAVASQNNVSTTKSQTISPSNSQKPTPLTGIQSTLFGVPNPFIGSNIQFKHDNHQQPHNNHQQQRQNNDNEHGNEQRQEYGVQATPFPTVLQNVSQVKALARKIPSLEIQERLLKNKASKKNGKHLILDLDETLVHTFDARDKFLEFVDELTPDQKKRVYVLNFPGGESLMGYIRPYAEDFLRVAFEEFESVGVWSAGTSYYVNLIVQTIFKQDKPIFVMSRDQCNELIISKEETPCRYKPLEVVYHRFPDHNEKNTVLVDDRHDICAFNCMSNVRIPEFMLTNETHDIMLGDSTLLVLASWFQSNEFRNASDFRLIKSRSPFKI